MAQDPVKGPADDRAATDSAQGPAGDAGDTATSGVSDALSGGMPEAGSDDASAMLAAAKRSKKKKKKKKKRNAKAKASELGTSRGIETMFRASYRVHMNLTSLADAKANIMISINGLILSIILGGLANSIDTNPWLLIPVSTVLLSTLSAIIFAVLAARPRINSQNITLDDVEANRKNILFFGNYTMLGENDFVAGMETLVRNPDRLYRNMIRDLYGIGSVLGKKFRMLRHSYNVFMVGMTLSVLSFIVAFVIEARSSVP